MHARDAQRAAGFLHGVLVVAAGDDDLQLLRAQRIDGRARLRPQRRADPECRDDALSAAEIQHAFVTAAQGDHHVVVHQRIHELARAQPPAHAVDIALDSGAGLFAHFDRTHIGGLVCTERGGQRMCGIALQRRGDGQHLLARAAVQ